MLQKEIFKICSTIIFLYSTSLAFAIEPINLPEVDKTSGQPLMAALNQRKSTRSFSKKDLPIETLSGLLWAASGMNRSDGKMTAPTAGDSREIDVYVAMSSGLYLYDVKKHILQPVLDQDIRQYAGKQDFTQVAPVNLIYVADLERIPYGSLNDFYAATDTGFISQNVYLYCASENLATVVLGWVDKDVLAKIMKLKKSQKIILTQPVGFPG